MASKEQLPRQSQKLPSGSSQSTGQSMIFVNVDFGGNGDNMLYGLRRHYSGVESVVRLYFEDNNGEEISAMEINVKSEKFAREFLGQSVLRIFDKEYSIQTLTRSLIVSKVGTGEKPEALLQDLSHNYIGIERIVRLFDGNGNAVNYIRVDFKVDSSIAKVMKDSYILIDGKRRPVQPYWSLINTPHQIQNGNAPVSQQPQQTVVKPPQQAWTKRPQQSVTKTSQNYLTEKRIKELFAQQQLQLESMIQQFENRWNARLSSLAGSSTNANNEQLLQATKDLAMVSQQFNHQNVQIQRQLGTVVNRVQEIRMKLDNKHAQEEWPQLTMQNGH